MQHSRVHHLRSIAILSGVLAVVSFGTLEQSEHGKRAMISVDGFSAQLVGRANYKNRWQPETMQARIATRMQKRLARGSRITPSLSALVKAVHIRQNLLSKDITVHFATHLDPEHTTWNVSAQRYPLWIKPVFTLTEAKFIISTVAISKSFEDESILQIDPPLNAILRSVKWAEDENSVSRAEIEGVAKEGYLPDSELIANSVAKAFSTDLDEISIQLEKKDGRIINMTSIDLGDLKLWAAGNSNYKGSTYARSQNVQKALNQHVNNTIVRPGETYSFNSTLGGPVSQGNGWHMAKVIFNGGDLEYAPGGGICQASTTVYRAIVNAGFPVEERRAHSLYVSYYKTHGVGIDATIYPGSQDLVFRNDSDNHLIIQAYNDGKDATVSIFGSPDGRRVELNGPYFAGTAPEGYLYKGRGIKETEIVWEQKVTYPDGRITNFQIGSRYRTLPKSVAREFAPGQIIHTAAPAEPLAGNNS